MSVCSIQEGFDVQPVFEGGVGGAGDIEGMVVGKSLESSHTEG